MPRLNLPCSRQLHSTPLQRGWRQRSAVVKQAALKERVITPSRQQGARKASVDIDVWDLERIRAQRLQRISGSHSIVNFRRRRNTNGTDTCTPPDLQKPVHRVQDLCLVCLGSASAPHRNLPRVQLSFLTCQVFFCYGLGLWQLRLHWVVRRSFV